MTFLQTSSSIWIIKKSRNKKMNIKELANKLNLSVTSVSRALNGHPNISVKTTAKIRKRSGAKRI